MRAPQHQSADDNHQQAVHDAEEAVPFEEQEPLEVAPQIENQRVEELVDGEDGEQQKLGRVEPFEESDAEGYGEVEQQKDQFDAKKSGEMFDNKVRMACYVAGVEVGDAKVEEYVEDIAQVEDGEIEAVHLGTDGVLHAHIDAQNPERLDQQVGQQYPEKSR